MLVAIMLTSLFYSRKLNNTVSYRKHIARLHYVAGGVVDRVATFV